ncbi:MAG: hypothetical protein FJX57_25290, partial [Alphaproteobacteria bacterium]|nr:hypothetical protein [Alphaproteobacteria bacterium]
MARAGRWILVALAALLWTVSASSARAQDDDGDHAPTAPMVLDGRALFTVRGTEAYPAPERAERIRDESVGRRG